MERRTTTYVLALGLSALLASGCEGDSSEGAAGAGGEADREVGPVEALGKELEGIYDITEHMLNLTACEVGGSKVAGHGHLAVFTFGAAQYAEVRAISCESVEACRESVDAAMHGRTFSANFSFVFDTKGESDSLLGTDAVAVREGATCYRKLTEAELERDGTDLSIEARFWRGDDYAPDDQDSCSTSEGDDPSQDGPCSELETLSATHVAEL